MMSKTLSIRFLPVLILALLLVRMPLKSQNSSSLLVAVPSPNNNLISEDILEQFETAHPEIDVQIVEFPAEWLIQQSFEIEAYSTNIRNLVQRADVLVVSDRLLFSALLSKNYFLDIAPLITADANFDLRAFHPLVVNAFTDDEASTWGLASAVALDALFYKPASFESSGLDYPTTSWTLSDFERVSVALQSLSGKPEMLIQSPGLLISALWNSPLSTQTAEGYALQFTDSDFIAMLQEWQNLRARDLIDIAAFPDETFAVQLMNFSHITSLTDEFEISLLPNNVADLTAYGFAVSAATQSPYLAYELSRYLVAEVRLSQRFGGSFPTKFDQLTQYLEEFSPDVQFLIQDAMNNPLNINERLAIAYLNQVLGTGDVSLANLENIQVELTSLALSLNTISQSSLAVQTPIPTAQANANQITIRFGLDTEVLSIYFREWRDLIEQFTEADPEIGAIQLVSPDFQGSFQLLSQDSDCFYFPLNIIPSTDLTRILSLSPLLAADANFDERDFVGGNMLAFQREEQIWGLPLMIAPDILAYDPVILETANVLPNGFHWTITDFEFALRELQPNLPPDTAPMMLFQYSTTENYILMLVAAYGGLPFDYRTDPIFVDFLNPQTVNAIRSALDLAREGLISYQHLDTFSDLTTQFLDPNTPLYPISFGSLNYSDSFRDSFGFVSYPIGRDYTPMSYRIGTGYISSTTNYPEACYRWLRALTERADMFFGFPAYYSLATDNPFVQDYISLTQAQNAIIFPNTIPFYHNVERTWLFRAFDHYVFENADLDLELNAAQTLVFELRTCIAGVEQTQELTSNGTPRWVSQQARCAINLDPRLQSMLGGLAGED